MGWTTAFAAFLAVSLGVQGQVAPRQPDARLPGVVEVHAGTSDPFVSDQLRDARRDIERRRDNGELSRREARRLRREVNRISDLSERYGRDGLSDTERRELQLHAQVLTKRADPLPRR